MAARKVASTPKAANPQAGAATAAGSGRFAGMRFVVDKRHPLAENRRQILAFEGATLQDEPTPETEYVVVGFGPGGKPTSVHQRALALIAGGATIQLLDEDRFAALLAPDAASVAAWVRAGHSGIQHLYSVAILSYSQGTWPNVAGVDLSGLAIERFHAPIHLPEVRLQNAQLRHMQLHEARGAQADGAVAQDLFARNLDHASFRGAQITRGTISSLAHADFSGVGATEVVFHAGPHAQFCKGTFRDCVFLTFPQANFEEAQAYGATFAGGDLSGANLRGAEFSRGIFARTKMAGADLRGAKLRDARLVQADLSEAKLDGADFLGAMVAGCNFAGVDLSKAKNLTLQEPRGKLGPALQALEGVAQQSIALDLSFVLTTPEGEVTIQAANRAGQYFHWTCDTGGSRIQDHGTSLAQRFFDLANCWWAGSTPRLDTLTVRSQKCPKPKKELERLVVEAMCEAFGVEAPSEQDLKHKKQAAKAGKNAEKAALLDDLKGGPAGVKRFNALEDRSGLDLRKAALPQAKLSGVNFAGLNLENADLSAANLSKANLESTLLRAALLAGANLTSVKGRLATFREADLAGADLSKAQVDYANFERAVLTGAKLAGTNLEHANLAGADFSQADLAGARLKNARYNEHTKFPADFDPGSELRWTGAGVEPAQRKHLEANLPKGPIDLGTFMEILAERTDQARLAKALAMLKADRFQLFAEATSDQLLGVVKSQNDPELVYACRLAADGAFACCTQNLNPCGGLRGALCKHLLALVIGLASKEQLDPTQVNAWAAASRLQKPALDKDQMSEIFLRYKGAQAGEIDWRPTETTPEDFYAF